MCARTHTNRSDLSSMGKDFPELAHLNLGKICILGQIGPISTMPRLLTLKISGMIREFSGMHLSSDKARMHSRLLACTTSQVAPVAPALS